MGEGRGLQPQPLPPPGCQSQGAYLGPGSRQWCRAALERIERSLLGSGRRRLRTGESANPSSLGSPCRLRALRGPWEQVSALEAPSPPPPPRRANRAPLASWVPWIPIPARGWQGGAGVQGLPGTLARSWGEGGRVRPPAGSAPRPLEAPPHPPPEAQAGGLTGCSADSGGSGGGGGGGAQARPGLQPYKGCPAHPRPAPPRC